jgi:MFS family permease
VLHRRLLLTSALLSLGVGGILIGLTSYVPTYLEGSIAAPPLLAGLALAALTLGWPIAATFSGRLFYLRYGFRPTVLVGMGLVVAGIVLLVVRAHTPQVAVVAVACFVTGLGMGLVASPSLIAAQASVGWADRGVVTGANMFARSIGSAVGVAIFGAVANAVLDASGGPTQPSAVVDATAAVFWAVLGATVLTFLAALLMPKVRADDAELQP